jgi:hypothetical protein
MLASIIHTKSRVEDGKKKKKLIMILIELSPSTRQSVDGQNEVKSRLFMRRIHAVKILIPTMPKIRIVHEIRAIEFWSHLRC